jgi:DNA-directed RNA polymerase subunit RPC12/RpoP
MDLQYETIAEMNGEDGKVSVRVRDMPVLACPHGHEKRFVDRAFGPEMAEVVSAKIPRASAKGMVSKRYSCSNCKAPLDAAAAQAGTLEIPLQLKQGGPFRLEVRTSLMKCASCGKEQTAQETESEIFEALANAFKSSTLKP